MRTALLLQPAVELGRVVERVVRLAEGLDGVLGHGGEVVRSVLRGLRVEGVVDVVPGNVDRERVSLELVCVDIYSCVTKR